MFDLVIVTAANVAQAKGYRAQLKGRKNFVVVPDPGDRRVGSLGATVNVLRKLRLPASSSVLICHSGGDAKRTPSYAAMGKAFVPMNDGRPMLDHIVEAMEKLPSRAGVTICCGDVIPYLDYAKVSFAQKGVTGVAYPDGPYQATRHGVYVVGQKGATGGVHKVRAFLQKPQVKRGRFLIDTGILFFDWTTAAKMTRLPIAGDIYEEFPELLLNGFAPFNVAVVPKCDFFHIGSSRELLEKLGKGGKLVDACLAPIGRLGGDNIVTNVPESYGKVELKKGECLTSLPLGNNKWYHLKYCIEDNFKSDGLWERHGLGEKMKQVNHVRLLSLRQTFTAAKVPRTVRVTAPVRIDFAGGWSDTPPICNHEGGVVLAAAVTLNGKRPIEVIVSPRKDKLIKVESRDLGKRTIIRSQREINDHHDPHDWCCLVKSALTVTGFKFGSRGVNITISANLPKGSGMGTSSILGAATIAALIGETDVKKVGALTLKLEQEMCTGGGWEDQFAGMTPGIKIMRSKRGNIQLVDIESVKSQEKFIKILKSRSLLYFTGQKRMARNVLRRVIGFYLNNPHNFGKILIKSIKECAERAKLAVERCDINTFAKCVNEYWRDKKLLDAGSTNEQVDDIIDMIRPNISAVSLTGAGGGGFMYILAKSAKDAVKVRKFLEKNPPSKHSKFYDFDIDLRGIALDFLI